MLGQGLLPGEEKSIQTFYLISKGLDLKALAK